MFKYFSISYRIYFKPSICQAVCPPTAHRRDPHALTLAYGHVHWEASRPTHPITLAYLLTVPAPKLSREYSSLSNEDDDDDGDPHTASDSAQAAAAQAGTSPPSPGPIAHPDADPDGRIAVTHVRTIYVTFDSQFFSYPHMICVRVRFLQ